MKPRNHWTFSDWQKNDPKGLAEMKETNPDKYKSLYCQQFRDEFTHTWEEMKGWTYKDYLEKDGTALQWLKDNLPITYNHLYKQYLTDLKQQ